MKKQPSLILLCMLCCVAVLQTPFDVQAQSNNLRINGTVVGIGGRLGGRTRQFTLIVNRYSTVAEVRTLNEALRSGGQDGLLNALNDMDAGRIQIGANVGVPANAIIATPWGEGGTKLTVFYERNVNFYELRYGTRSSDYRVGYAEIFLERNGEGEGTLIPAAQVDLEDGNTWVVENFGIYPARLVGLRASGSVRPR